MNPISISLLLSFAISLSPKTLGIAMPPAQRTSNPTFRNPTLNLLSNHANAANALSFAANVERAMESMNDPSLPPDFHRASLYYITLRLRNDDPPTPTISYLWDILLVYELPAPTSPYRNAILMYNKLGWTGWTAPWISRWPFPYMGPREESLQWAELQALMRRRAGGFDQPISRLWIACAGPREGYLVLGYWFELGISMLLRVDALSLDSRRRWYIHPKGNTILAFWKEFSYYYFGVTLHGAAD